VVDERRRSVPDATVSNTGYQGTVPTDIMGNFVVPAHVADGQIVQVRAQKGHLVGELSVPAGNVCRWKWS